MRCVVINVDELPTLSSILLDGIHLLLVCQVNLSVFLFLPALHSFLLAFSFLLLFLILLD